ncbi:protein of unknown function [Paraburkholderia kururiensis]
MKRCVSGCGCGVIGTHHECAHVSPHAEVMDEEAGGGAHEPWGVEDEWAVDGGGGEQAVLAHGADELELVAVGGVDAGAVGHGGDAGHEGGEQGEGGGGTAKAHDAGVEGPLADVACEQAVAAVKQGFDGAAGIGDEHVGVEPDDPFVMGQPGVQQPGLEPVAGALQADLRGDVAVDVQGVAVLFAVTAEAGLGDAAVAGDAGGVEGDQGDGVAGIEGTARGQLGAAGWGEAEGLAGVELAVVDVGEEGLTEARHDAELGRGMGTVVEADGEGGHDAPARIDVGAGGHDRADAVDGLVPGLPGQAGEEFSLAGKRPAAEMAALQECGELRARGGGVAPALGVGLRGRAGGGHQQALAPAHEVRQGHGMDDGGVLAEQQHERVFGQAGEGGEQVCVALQGLDLRAGRAVVQVDDLMAVAVGEGVVAMVGQARGSGRGEAAEHRDGFVLWRHGGLRRAWRGVR